MRNKNFQPGCLLRWHSLSELPAPLYWSYYPHRSRELVSSVCGIFFLTCLGPVRKKVHAIIQQHTPSSMVWKRLLLDTFKTAFVCLLIYCDETVHFVPVCCLAIWYIQYKMVSFPQENEKPVQFVDVSSLPECCPQGPTKNQKRVHAVSNKLW